MRVWLMGDNTKCQPALSCKKNGNHDIRYPNKNISAVRLIIFQTTSELLCPANFFIAKLMALPTANKNEGNTRSVGVKPNQAACWSGAKGVAPLPGVFTIIIKQIVIPRKTSSERNLFGFLSIGVNKRIKFNQDY